MRASAVRATSTALCPPAATLAAMSMTERRAKSVMALGRREGDQRRARRHGLVFLDVDTGDHPRPRAGDVAFGLHRLDDRDHRALLHPVAGLDEQLPEAAAKRRLDQLRALRGHDGLKLKVRVGVARERLDPVELAITLPVRALRIEGGAAAGLKGVDALGVGGQKSAIVA